MFKYREYPLLIMLLTCCIMLSACADRLPVPGGDRMVNEDIFDNKQDLMDRLATLDPGTPKAQVFATLNVEEKDLIKIDRRAIVTALFGDNRISYESYAPRDADNLRRLLRELYGYRLDYSIVEREYGFANPYRFKTREQGFSYGVTLIFHDGKLFERPIWTGGAVKESSSKTIFDYFGLSQIMGGI